MYTINLRKTQIILKYLIDEPMYWDGENWSVCNEAQYKDLYSLPKMIEEYVLYRTLDDFEIYYIDPKTRKIIADVIWDCMEK